jgi:hypothetical protein
VAVRRQHEAPRGPRTATRHPRVPPSDLPSHAFICCAAPLLRSSGRWRVVLPASPRRCDASRAWVLRYSFTRCPLPRAVAWRWSGGCRSLHAPRRCAHAPRCRCCRRRYWRSADFLAALRRAARGGAAANGCMLHGVRTSTSDDSSAPSCTATAGAPCVACACWRSAPARRPAPPLRPSSHPPPPNDVVAARKRASRRVAVPRQPAHVQLVAGTLARQPRQAAPASWMRAPAASNRASGGG